MARICVEVPEQERAALQRLAKERSVPIAELVRRGLRHVLAEENPSREELWDRAFSVAGTGHSGLGDLGRRHDDYLAERDG